ncbi:MAG: uroporphyrinogen-III C-methyltransferase [Ornithinimicrobium sp.]
MSLVVPVQAAHVLITHGGPRVSETVHALIDQGASVTLAAAPGAPSLTLDPRVADLLARNLVTVAVDPDLSAYDVVLRDPHGALPAQDRAHPESSSHGTAGTGRVVLLGGGLGAPGLMTLDGLDAIRAADVVVCDRLAPLGLLTQARPDCEVIHVGKIPRGDFTPQEQINALLVQHAGAGRFVVRLKGGDPYVFGRGGEEWNACVEAGVPVTVVPGVTSSIAAPALAGVPVTHRHLSQGYVVVSGHVTPSDPRCDVDWARLAGLKLTLVILMGVAALEEISAVLQEHGMDPATPAMSVADAGMPSQRSATGTVQSIAKVAADAGVSAPAVTVIGAVVDALRQP